MSNSARPASTRRRSTPPERSRAARPSNCSIARRHAGRMQARDAREEFANTLTHGVGAVVALVAGIVLVAIAAQRGDAWRTVGAAAFAASLFLLYLASALYHAAPPSATKARLKVLDHCAIYLLIAGTYTPFTVVALRGSAGWWLFGAIWTLAAVGILFKLRFTGRFRLLSTGLYVAMGWLGLLAVRPLLAAVGDWTFAWLIAGGVAYTAGTAFYHRPGMPYAHAVWHVFVVAGSVCHYLSVWPLLTRTA